MFPLGYIFIDSEGEECMVLGSNTVSTPVIYSFESPHRRSKEDNVDNVYIVTSKKTFRKVVFEGEIINGTKVI